VHAGHSLSFRCVNSSFSLSSQSLSPGFRRHPVVLGRFSVLPLLIPFLLFGLVVLLLFPLFPWGTASLTRGAIRVFVSVLYFRLSLCDAFPPDSYSSFRFSLSLFFSPFHLLPPQKDLSFLDDL